MMKNLKQSLTLTLLAALSIGSMHAMEPAPQQKQQLLQRLVTQYKINRALIRQSQTHALKLPKEKIKQLRAERRKILKQVAIAGLTTAFLAAIGIATAVAVKKRGKRGKAPAGPSLTFEEAHERFRPPGGAGPEATEPFEEEKRERLRAFGTLRRLDEPAAYEEMRKQIGEDPELEQLLEETE